MSQERAEQALNRLEAAIARIERAARPVATSDSGLAERHEQLRSAVARSLRQLDTLIESQPAEGQSR